MQQVRLEETRAQARQRLTAEPLDVLVIGGGIVGSGVLRDAAMRGLRAGLVEQNDLASGTSSRSSRLLHGGLRYLAQGRIGLVYEASQEKRVLHRIASHLAAPLPFFFPAYRKVGWPLWQLRLGVKLYDILCWGKNLGPSSTLGRDEARRQLPELREEGLAGAVRYYDGLTNDARLVIDTIRSAAERGAVVANYTRVEETVEEGGGWRCRVADLCGGGTYEVSAQAIVNAAGPWASGFAPSSIRLRLTKGVHLVVDRQRLPLPGALVMEEKGRIVFAIPWGKRMILGTTDTDYDGPIEAVHTEPEDVAYILNLVNEYFPQARLGPEDVLATWAGLRPLVDSGRGGPSDISRAHEIRMPRPGWFDVAGGKLTTYRRIGQQVVDRLLRHLGRKRIACRTAAEPLLEKGQAVGISSIVPQPLGAELVEHCCREEWAVHLDDVMLRRTSWHYYLDGPEQAAEQVANWMAEILGWDAAVRQEELERYRKVLH